MMGVQKTGDFLEKGTWGLAIFLMVLAMAINVAVKGGVDQGTGTQKYNDQIKNASKSTTPAAAPLSIPGNGLQQQPPPAPKPATPSTKK